MPAPEPRARVRRGPDPGHRPDGGVALSSGSRSSVAQLVAVLPALLVVNLLFLAYRIVAAVDAYRVAAYLNGSTRPGAAGSAGPPPVSPLSVAGLLAVCLVIAGGHGFVAIKDARRGAGHAELHLRSRGSTDSCDDSPTDSPGPPPAGRQRRRQPRPTRPPPRPARRRSARRCRPRACPSGTARIG